MFAAREPFPLAAFFFLRHRPLGRRHDDHLVLYFLTVSQFLRTSVLSGLTVSLPLPQSTVSALPFFDVTLSLPSPARITRLCPLPPLMLSLPGPPSSTSAPLSPR